MGSILLFGLWLLILIGGLVLIRMGRVKFKDLKQISVSEEVSSERGHRTSPRYNSPSVSKGNPDKKAFGNAVVAHSFLWGGVGAAVLGLILSLGMCLTTVSAKNVGVVVNFGAVSENTLSPGLKMKLPWTQIIEIDGTIQTDQYKDETCIPVIIGDGSQACVTVTNRWQINPEKASSIYEQHRSNDPTQEFRDAVVSTEFEQALSQVLGDYNPISSLKIVGGEDAAPDVSFVPDYRMFSDMIEKDMRERLAKTNQAQVEGITFTYLKLSDNTQRKLDDYIAEVGATRIAMQQEETAKAQSRANKELSASVSNDPNVLVSRCLDFLKEASQSQYALPAGFSCWPGGGSAVVVPRG